MGRSGRRGEWRGGELTERGAEARERLISEGASGRKRKRKLGYSDVEWSAQEKGKRLFNGKGEDLQGREARKKVMGVKTKPLRGENGNGRSCATQEEGKNGKGYENAVVWVRRGSGRRD